jgi:RNA polymerase sigma factor (sigma-70 family)
VLGIPWPASNGNAILHDNTRVTLIERLRDGSDSLAWDEFFGRYWRLIYSASKARGCSPGTAEEVVQEVMLVVFERRDVFRYDPAKGRFRDWLCAVVRNKVVEIRRGPAGRIRGVGGDGVPEIANALADDGSPDEYWEAAFEESLLAMALDSIRRQMNPRTYQAFELFALGELSGAEVARLTGLTQNAVYQARKAVLKRLAELGKTYRDNGRLPERVKRALESAPAAHVERSLTRRVSRSMQSRQERRGSG